MTIYGTPGSTPANMNPFQGTQPGSPVQATLQPVNPGVGLFPPNSNNASGDSVLASISRGTLPINAFVTGSGLTSSVGAGTGSGGKTVANSLSDGDRNGYGSSVGVDSLNSDLNGQGSLGAGGSNQTEGPTSGVSSQASTQQPVNTLTLATTPAVTYGG
jgi:hypothetical protein